MRLLLINYEYPPLGGGAGNATANLAREWAALGHEVLVMTSRYADLPVRETRDGYQVWRIPALRRAADRSNPLEMLSFLLSAMVHVLRLGRAGRPTVSVAFFGIPSAPAAWLLRVLYGVPYWVSLRGGDVPGFQPYDLKHFHRLTRPIIYLLWRGAAGVVANSQGLAALASRTALRLPIPVIPNGVDTRFFCPPAAPAPPSAWLFAGRLREQKGLHFLIQALAHLSPSERASLHMTVVGDGPWGEQFQRLAQEVGVADCLRFVGWLDRPNLAEAYRRHALFILPSLDEGMPNVLLEAMASGMALIATDIAGNQELVAGNGWLVPPADSAALADALRQALHQPEALALLGQKSRARAEARSWRVAAQAYLDLFSPILEAKR